MGRRSMPQVGLLGLMSLVVAGCSGGTPGGSDGSFAERLRFIPASVTEAAADEETVEVVMADLERASEVAGLERPDGTGDPEAVREYLWRLTGGSPGEEPAPVAAMLPDASNYERSAAAQDEFEAEMGWSLMDVSWFAEYRGYPGLFTVMGGDFDESRLTDALGEPEEGVWRVGGEDLEVDVAEASVARELGESLRLAIDNDRLVMGRATQPVEDAQHGGRDTLADDASLRAMAEALDEHEAYTAMLRTGGSHEWGAAMEGITPAAVDAGEAAVLAEPFVGVGFGLAYEDGRADAILTYTHDDSAAAAANGEALRDLVAGGRSLRSGQPWADLLSVEDVQVDRTTLVARLRIDPEAPALSVHQAMVSQDGLVLHR